MANYSCANGHTWTGVSNLSPKFTPAELGCKTDGCGLKALPKLDRSKPLSRVSEKRREKVHKARSTITNKGKGFAASKAQQNKVKGLVCVVCKLDFYEGEIHPAHVYPRRLAKCDCPEGVVPLCAKCHGRYDDQNDPFDLMPALISGGYRAEIVHAFVHHDAPMGEVLRIINGEEWAPANLGAAA